MHPARRWVRAHTSVTRAHHSPNRVRRIDPWVWGKGCTARPSRHAWVGGWVGAQQNSNPLHGKTVAHGPSIWVCARLGDAADADAEGGLVASLPDDRPTNRIFAPPDTRIERRHLISSHSSRPNPTPPPIYQQATPLGGGLSRTPFFDPTRRHVPSAHASMARRRLPPPHGAPHRRPPSIHHAPLPLLLLLLILLLGLLVAGAAADTEEMVPAMNGTLLVLPTEGGDGGASSCVYCDWYITLGSYSIRIAWACPSIRTHPPTHAPTHAQAPQAEVAARKR